MARTPPRPPKGTRFGGRTKGTQNKATAHAREAIAAFVDGQASRLEGLLEKIEAADGPKAAFACLVDLLEFHVPKLARTELTGIDGADLLPKVLLYKVEP